MEKSSRQELLNEVDKFVSEHLFALGTFQGKVVGIDSVMIFPHCGEKIMNLFDAPTGLRGLLVELLPPTNPNSELFDPKHVFPSWFDGFPVLYRIKEK